MRNKVVYCARYNKDKVAEQLGNCYVLTSDNWDDYGYKTYFHVYIYKNGEQYKDFSTKILFKDEDTSSIIFNSELRSVQNDFVTLENIREKYKFISLGNHYEELKKIFPDKFEEILEVLNDTIYLEKNEPTSELLELKNSKGFDTSLCRDQSAKKVLEEAKYLLYRGEELDENRFQFNFNFQLSERNYSYNFNFVNNDLPHRINVLVGKNGSGKSQTLIALSEYFIGKQISENKFNIEVDSHPNFISNLMAVTYNIYEDFYISKERDNISIEYKYLGFRDYNNNFNKDIPSLEAFRSFKKIYEKDRNNYTHDIHLSDISYRNKIIDFLNHAFKCDGIGLKFNNDNYQPYIDQGFEYIENFIVLKNEVEHQKFVKDINFNDFESKLYFINNGKIFYLSSGQQMFANLVINLLSLIKKNSLILIDEPENTLHPNLEIDFMRILKAILEEFDSFAIIATHSSIIVREVPSEFVRVIKIDEDNQPVIVSPTISTFGADIRKITNYVFDDIFVENKPFEIWIEEEKEKFSTFDEFKEKFKDKLSYDFLNYCYNFWDE